MSRFRFLLVACLAFLGMSLAIAADRVEKKPKPPKAPKHKLHYTLSNSSSNSLTITLLALAPDNDPDANGKTFTDRAPAQKTKKCTATVYDDLGFDFLVTIQNGNNVLLDELHFDLVPFDPLSPGQGQKYGTDVFPSDNQIDFAYLNGELIWSVNPKN